MLFKSLKQAKRRPLLLALFWTALTAFLPLAVAAWFVWGTVTAFLTQEDGETENGGAAAEEQTGGEPPAPTLPPPPPLPEGGGEPEWLRKEWAIARAVANGRSKTFRFSEEELNAMIQYARRRGEFQGQARIGLSDSLVKADVKMAVTGLPLLEGRFLDATILFGFALEKDDEKLYIERIEPRSGDWRTRALLSSLQKRDLTPLLEQTTLVEDLRQRFQRIAVQEGTLVVETRGRDRTGREQK